MLLKAFFSLALVAAMMGLRYAVSVRTATIGRLFRDTTTTSRGASTSILMATSRTATSATTGILFVLSKGSPNSERDAPVAKRSGWVSTKYELQSSRKTPRERIQFLSVKGSGK